MASGPALARRQRLYTQLCVYAANNELCPCNDVLAEKTGFGSGHTVSRALGELRDQGHIEIERRSFQRRITICATGERTAEPPSWSPALPPFTPKRPVHAIAAKAVELSGRPARDILGRSRFREHVRVRHVIFDAAVREGWGRNHIARVLGFDHSTVNHGLKALPRYASREPDTAELIAALRRELPPLAMIEEAA